MDSSWRTFSRAAARADSRRPKREGRVSAAVDEEVVAVGAEGAGAGAVEAVLEGGAMEGALPMGGAEAATGAGALWPLLAVAAGRAAPRVAPGGVAGRVLPLAPLPRLVAGRSPE